MSHRANFVVVDEEGWRLYYGRWSATRIREILIGGPVSATQTIWVDDLCEDRENDWLDDVWAEAGAVVDHTARRLHFYGWVELYALPDRRAYLRFLELTWPGWEIRWAYGRLAELAATVGVKLRTEQPYEWELAEPLKTGSQWVRHLLTVRDADGELTVYPLTDPYRHPAWRGPALLERLPEQGLREVELSEWPTGGGLHVDVQERTVEAWVSCTAGSMVSRLAERWPGWRVRFCGDRFEEQEARCGGAVTFPVLDLKAALRELAESMRGIYKRDPMARLLDEVLRITEPDTEPGPGSAARRRIEPTPEEWAALQRAAAELNERL
ncbi:hypothetical protein [Thermomonospora catenispora]|uniref:hypothetical protein n=1 Tax=Thermomonospora catenispora TaxID=2493090 RepID=UPI00111E18CD|nr:hypothetical protein [Thermomonospora catenispora]TNY35704.1 hypothetical protein EIO00_17330 [Thermomonospora catenispora]